MRVVSDIDFDEQIRIHAALMARSVMARRNDPKLGMKETDLQDAIVDAAAALRFRTYHTFDSRRSPGGFPDLVLAGAGRTIFAELKSTQGEVRRNQKEWLMSLAKDGNHVFVWHPYDWLIGTIEQELKGPRI